MVQLTKQTVDDGARSQARLTCNHLTLGKFNFRSLATREKGN